MSARRHKPGATQWASATLGLLLSVPAAAIQLHLDAATLQVPAFILPAEQPLRGVERWQLAGAFHSNQAQRSLALISIDGGPPFSVHVGEVIAQGIHLQAVFTDHVLLRRADSSAPLFLQSATGTNAPNSAEIPTIPSATPVVSAACAEFSATRVPQEELVTLGICPPPAP